MRIKSSFIFCAYIPAVNCGPPSDLGNATWTALNFIFTSVANYSCDIGFELKGGSNFKVCSCKGNWTGDNITCAGLFTLDYSDTKL